MAGFPADPNVLDRVKPQYETLKGWNKPTTGCRAWYDLPVEARTYIEFIETFIGVKVKWIGVGPARDHMIMR